VRVQARSRRARRRRIAALRRRLIVAAAALAAFSTVFHSGWTVSVDTGDGRMILLLAALGIFLALRYRQRRVRLMLLGEAVFGMLVALTAIAHFDWGEGGLGLGLLLLAGPVWFAAAALPDRGVRWIEAVLTGETGDDELIRGSSSKDCPGCDQRLRFAARSCGFCGFSFNSGRTMGG